MTIFERVREEVAAQLGLEDSAIEMDSRLSELGADSLDKQSLLIDIEGEFGIEIPQDEMQKFYTVRDIVRYIETED